MNRADEKADGGEVHLAACDLDDSHVLHPHLSNVPEGDVRCSRCFERGHKKFDCDAIMEERPLDSVLPKLNKASP